ncbi:acetate/propionate family kinase [Acidithiobacillus sp.]|uniref:acetate/propionate family kinase n=1 Tax=Acidithiobacillus sp. TaxID=1872118 RepID=UPI0025B801FA|nr:acetate/propionate family kinase [Acidithiobacillus sp.]
MAGGLTSTLLCINSGSSSLKFAVYALPVVDQGQCLAEGAVERIGQSVGRLWIQTANTDRHEERGHFADPGTALAALFRSLDTLSCPRPAAVGHRVVSGGPRRLEHTRIDTDVLQDLRNALAFAPLHLPAEIAAIEAVAASWPEIPQVACFDTAFHRDIPEVAARFPLPRNLWHEGVRKYGFHGLSYEYIVSQLPDAGRGRSIVAHLGNGASLAAIADGRCLDTSMGLTPTGGVVMGTRSGDLDPGVLLYLIEEKGYNGPQLERLLNRLAGMLAISGVSGDVQTLLAQRDKEPHVAQALDIFAYSVRKTIGAYMAVLGGLDRLVFTGGIGEHAAPLRWSICRPLEGLGIRLDPVANTDARRCISREDSPIEVLVIPTNEDLTIARHTQRIASLA